MKTQTLALEDITNLKQKPQDQQELPNVTYKQQTDLKTSSKLPK